MNDAIRQAAERLRAAGFESARREARILWEHAENLSLFPIGGEGSSDSDSRLLASDVRTPPHPNPFESLVARRLAREPIAYILGEKEFWSLPFKVGPGCLIPRPETETLVEQAMREFADRGAPLRVLDLGTGSGCLLVAFLVEYRNAGGIGVDISEDALKWAAANADRHGVFGACELRLTDWRSLEPAQFNIVFANPPYIASPDLTGLAADVACFEPESALNGGPDGLAAYRALAPVLRDNLAPEGRAFLEIGQGQDYMVCQILERQSLQVLRVVDDLAGIPRCVVVRLHGEAHSGSSK